MQTQAPSHDLQGLQCPGPWLPLGVTRNPLVRLRSGGPCSARASAERALFPALPRRTRDRLLFSRSSNGKSSERTNLLQKHTASLLSAPLTPALLPRGRAHPPAISCHTEDRDRIWSTALPQSLRQCLALNETVERMKKKKKSPITASESPFQLFHPATPFLNTALCCAPELGSDGCCSVSAADSSSATQC